MKDKRIYSILLLMVLAGYVWLFLNINTQIHVFGCLFKNATNIPCPSCGTTRAILSILEGDLKAGLKFNPLGYIYLIAMIIVPFIILIDYFFKKNIVIKVYNLFILKLSNKNIFIPFFSIILLNWVWNIIKML